MMSECKAAIMSYTHASRARQLLRQKGYACEIRRLPELGDAGCGYILTAKVGCGVVSQILAKEGIPFQRYEGRDA